MSYGHLGQQKTGHLRSVSKNPKTEQGGPIPQQTMRGYGGAASRNTTDRGKPNGEGQKARGFRQSTAKTPTIKNVSAGRIKKGRA